MAINKVGCERVTITNDSDTLLFEFEHINTSMAAYKMRIPKEDLRGMIEVLQEAERLFGLELKIPTTELQGSIDEWQKRYGKIGHGTLTCNSEGKINNGL